MSKLITLAVVNGVPSPASLAIAARFGRRHADDMIYWQTRRNVAQNLRLQDKDEEASTRELIAYAESVLQQARYEPAVLKQQRAADD